MFTKMAHEAFMKLKQVRRRSWGGGYHIYIYIFVLARMEKVSSSDIIMMLTATVVTTLLTTTSVLSVLCLIWVLCERTSPAARKTRMKGTTRLSCINRQHLVGEKLQNPTLRHSSFNALAVLQNLCDTKLRIDRTKF